MVMAATRPAQNNAGVTQQGTTNVNVPDAQLALSGHDAQTGANNTQTDSSAQALGSAATSGGVAQTAGAANNGAGNANAANGSGTAVQVTDPQVALAGHDAATGDQHHHRQLHQW